jgi:hypothetical protein
MPYFNVVETTYQVKENNIGKVVNEQTSVKTTKKYFKNKRLARQTIAYLNRSSVNKRGLIKKFALTR